MRQTPVAATVPERPVYSADAESMRGGFRYRRVAQAGTLAIFLAALALSHAGYSPVAWGWSGLALFSSIVLALVLSRDLSIRTRELLFIGCLGALFSWTLLSAVWASSATQPVLESQRMLVYIGACLSAFVLLRSSSYRALLIGIWAVTSTVCAYSLATRLFPTRLGTFDSIAGYRLSEPIGYWNGLGLFAGLGALLALGLVARSRTGLLRAAAGSSSVVLVSTLYFTFSRGSWLVLGGGLIAMLALDRRRLQALTALLVVAPWPAAGVWLASRAEGLTRLQVSLPVAADDGRRVAVAVAGLAVAGGLASFLFGVLCERVRVPRLVQLGFEGFVALVLAASLATVIVREGSPSRLAHRAYDAFTAPSRYQGDNLNQRLFSLSAGQRIPQWRVAWKDYRLHPWLGSGAGTYESYWLRYRPSTTTVKDAHNLYLETLAELGPIGLGLLVAGLALPLRAAIRARSRGLVPAAFGAYVAFLLNVVGEWEWELPAVTLAALFSACAIFLAARKRGDVIRKPLEVRATALAIALLLAAFAFVGLVGNSAVQSSADAAQRLELDRAESQARKAVRWMPWASTPWQALADAQFAQRDDEAGRRSLRRAIDKDPENWSLWYRLALVSSGKVQRRALAAASRLNSLDPRIIALKSQLTAARRQPRRSGGRGG